MNSVTFDQYRFKCLNTHTVKRWCSIEKHRMVPDHLLQNIPNFFVFSLEHFLRALNRVSMTKILELANDKWLV